MDVEEAAELMVRHGIRRLPVLDGGRLTGIITLDDIAVRTGDLELAAPHDRADHPGRAAGLLLPRPRRVTAAAGRLRACPAAAAALAAVAHRAGLRPRAARRLRARALRALRHGGHARAGARAGARGRRVRRRRAARRARSPRRCCAPSTAAA